MADVSEFPIPGDPHLERIVLGAVMVRGNVEYAVSTLGPDDFSNEVHRSIWETILDLHANGEGVNRITVFSRAKDLRHTQITLGLLSSLDDDVPDIVNVESYIDRLSEIGLRRKVFIRLENHMKQLSVGEELAPAVLDRIESIRADLGAADREDSGILSGSGIISSLGGLEVALSPQRVVKAIPTHLGTMQEKFPGFQPGKLVLLAARPSIGKTALALQMASHAATLGHEVSYHSFEMGKEELLHRVLACQSSVHLSKISHANLSRGDVHAIGEVNRSGLLDRLYFDDPPRLSVPRLRKRLLSLPAIPELVVIDYLQLMESGGRTRNDEVSAISRALKLLAMELKICILALSQMSRPKDGGPNPKPELTMLRDSGSLEQDADVVWFLWSRLEDDEAETREVMLMMKKQRNGVKATFPISFTGAFQRFSDSMTPPPVPPAPRRQIGLYAEPEDAEFS